MRDTGPMFAKLRELYPDYVKQIKAEEDRVSKLLRYKEYASLPETGELIALCRQDIIRARVRLASDRTLDEAARQALWHIVDARDWFLQMVARDYDGELDSIEHELTAELER